MKFKDNIPIYLQIKDYIYQEIVTNRLAPGAKLPSVRDLALDLSVNTNTVQRALSELGDENVIEVQRGRGSFVVDDPKIVGNLKKKLIIGEIKVMYDNLTKLDLSKEEISYYLENYLEGRA